LNNKEFIEEVVRCDDRWVILPGNWWTVTAPLTAYRALATTGTGTTSRRPRGTSSGRPGRSRPGCVARCCSRCDAARSPPARARPGAGRTRRVGAAPRPAAKRKRNG